jgi:cholest-4-en-3-one 26-monooxygenase
VAQTAPKIDLSPLPSFPIIDPAEYEARGYPHELWTKLRAEEPVSWWEPPGMPPFWAITRHQDIEWISRQPERFLNSPLLAIFPKEQFDPENFPLRAMTKMDPPEHGRYRALAAARFTPRALEPLAAVIESIVDERLAAAERLETIDFVTDVAAWVSISVIAAMLGLPRDDWPALLRWTMATMAAADPEFRGDEGTAATAERAIREQFEYFSRSIAERRRNPGDDLVSVLARAEIDGRPLPDWELLSYVIVLMIAGNDTSRNAMVGGLAALLDHPTELAKVRRDTSLWSSAIEEMLRWVSPVVQFCRTPAEDTEIQGRRILAGQALCLFYPSANRDEAIFPDPFTFSVTRDPNPHLAFGVGEHFCLGAALARLEMRILFTRLFERAERVEAAGPRARLRSSFVGGIKHLPVRLALRR